MRSRSNSFGKKILGVVAVFALALTASIASLPVFGAHAASDANGKWYPDFGTIAESHAYADTVNVKIMEEGVVMMKNNNALPLAKGSGISVLGACSYNIIAGGTGAGSGAGISVTLTDALRDAGFGVNSLAEAFYGQLDSTASISSGMYGGSGSAQVVQEDPARLAPAEASFANFKTVVWTISRIGGEGSDLSRGNLPNNADKSKHYLEFNDNELKMIAYLDNMKKAGKIDKVVMLVNSPNVIEMGPAQDSDGIDAIVWIGQPGPNGLTGLANVLAGEVSPSGRTVDIWNADHKLDPTWVNFGDNSQNTWNATTNAFDENSLYNTNNGYVDATTSHDSHIVEYEEGIYFGYKYYETADAEAKANNYTGFDYDAQVVYPFGYGLSYTKFEQEFVTTADQLKSAIDNASGLDTKVQVTVKVKNTGDAPGKEVVQLYSHAPYNKGTAEKPGIEKPEVALVAFGKTKTLAPQGEQELTLEVRLGDIASFDYNDANGNDYKGYEIEAGDYEFRLQSDSHTLIGDQKLAVELTAKTTALDSDTDADNNTLFSNGDDFDTLLNLKEEGSHSNMRLMSRSNFAGTFPTAAAKADRMYGERLLALLSNTRTGAAGSHSNESRYLGNINGSDDKATDPWYKTNADIPADWTQAANTTTGRTNGRTAVQMSQMAGLNYWDTTSTVPTGHPYAGMTESAAWDAFMNQLTYAEMTSLVANGGYATPGLASVGKDQASDQDGPTRLTRNGYTFATAIVLASTWNVELAYEHGRVIGNDSLLLNTPGWYGPSMNTHRNPFCGRNFEYYSQDSLLAGKMAAQDVAGFQSKGGYAYIKHFALNEAETDRNGLATFLTEQAARENYFKSFEYAVKEGGAMALMTSFNRIGAIHGSGNHMMTQAMLRDEWGFKGQIVTDFYMGTMATVNIALRAGTELPLGRWGTATGTWDPTLRDSKGGVRDGNADAEGVVPESATQYYFVRQGALHILWVGANSNVNENGLKKYMFANKTINVIQGIAFNDTIGIDAAEYGASAVDYAGTLPDGIRLDAVTGAISGTVSGSADVSFNVTLNADIWTSASARVTLDVTPLVTANPGDNGIALEIYDEMVTDDVPTADDPVGTSAITAVAIGEVTGLPKGLTYADGVIGGTTEATDYTYTVVVNVTTVTVSSGWGGGANRVDTRTNAVNCEIVVGQGTQAPEAKDVASMEIDENGHLIVTYTDGTTADLGLVHGTPGAPGEPGAPGQDGKDAPSGCGSSVGIGTAGIVISVALAAAGVILIIRKNRKKD